MTGIQWSKNPIKVLGIYIGHNKENTQKANFSIRLKTLKSILNQWKQHSLSLIGKILIVKTFAISQFIYLANLVPFPQNIIAEVESILYEFIWDGRTCKVKRDLFIQDYENGGLKMPDLSTIVKVQKLKWIQLYINNHPCLWIYTMEDLIGVHNLELFFLCNFDKKDFARESIFYQEVLSAFCSARYIDGITNESVYKQFIYYNKHLKLDDKYIYKTEFINVGIWTVSDLLCNNEVVPFTLWKERGLDSKHFMLWRSMVDIVQKKCRFAFQQANELSDTNVHGIYILYESKKFLLRDMSSKQITQALVCHKNVISKAKQKYCEIFDIMPDANIWSSIYRLPFIVCYDNKIKEMQYKLLHRFIATNRLLYKMGKLPTQRCTFCNLYNESIEHLFFNCIEIKTCWSFIEDISDIVINCQHALLGYKLDEIQSIDCQFINSMIMYCKYYILRCKYKGVIPSLGGFKCVL